MEFTSYAHDSDKKSTYVRLPAGIRQRLAAHAAIKEPSPPRGTHRPGLPTARRFVTSTGFELWLRPLRSTDRGALGQFFAALSAHDRRQRFLLPRSALNDRELDGLLALKPGVHWSWVAEYRTSGETILAGVAQGCCDDDVPGSAEIAVAVLDRFQGQGVGRALLAAIAAEALATGIRHLHGYALAGNQRILEYARHRHSELHFATEGCVELRFAAPLLAADLPSDEASQQENT